METKKYLTQEMIQYGHEQFQKGLQEGKSIGYEEGRKQGDVEGRQKAMIDVLNSIESVQNTPKKSQEIDITHKHV